MRERCHSGGHPRAPAHSGGHPRAPAHRRTTAVRVGLGLLALTFTALGAGSGAVLAAGISPVSGVGTIPETGATPPAERAPAATSGPTPTAPVAVPDPGTQPAAGPGEGPPPAPPPTQPAPPGNLVPGADDTGPAPDVSNVSLTGEAYVVRQDFKAPLELHLGRYPRATVEVSRDLSTGFASFADPGFLGRFAVGSATGPTGNKTAAAPAWAECLFPQSPLTPTEDTRGTGLGETPSAIAKCRQGGAQAAGYYFRDPGSPAPGVPAPFSALSAASGVEATSNPAGATFTSTVSTLESVNIAGAVSIDSITNQVAVRTNGRPGGATVDTIATIGGLSIGGTPVALPSDSLEKLGPTLAQLPPVLTPLGALTFDVVPAQKEVAADGTMGSGRAAQLLVTLQNGEATVSFGLGYASARGRTILNPFSAPGRGGQRYIPPYSYSYTGQPLFPVSAARPNVGNFIDAYKSNLGLGARNPSNGGAYGFPPGGVAGDSGPPTAGLSVLPPPPGTANQNASRRDAYGGNGPWLALIGGSLIGLVLARYLAYSAAVRPNVAVSP